MQVAPSALGRVVHPTASPGAPFPLSPLLRVVQSLLGQHSCSLDGRGGAKDTTAATSISRGQSAFVQARSATAASVAPAVALAMRQGAQIVPCVVLGSSEGGGLGRSRFEVATAAVSSALGFGKRRRGVAIVMTAPVRVPFTAEPTQALVMEFAEAARAAAAKAGEQYSEAFFGGSSSY